MYLICILVTEVLLLLSELSANNFLYTIGMIPLYLVSRGGWLWPRTFLMCQLRYIANRWVNWDKKDFAGGKLKTILLTKSISLILTIAGIQEL